MTSKKSIYIHVISYLTEEIDNNSEQSNLVKLSSNQSDFSTAATSGF